MVQFITANRLLADSIAALCASSGSRKSFQTLHTQPAAGQWAVKHYLRVLKMLDFQMLVGKESREEKNTNRKASLFCDFPLRDQMSECIETFTDFFLYLSSCKKDYDGGSDTPAASAVQKRRRIMNRYRMVESRLRIIHTIICLTLSPWLVAWVICKTSRVSAQELTRFLFLL